MRKILLLILLSSSLSAAALGPELRILDAPRSVERGDLQLRVEVTSRDGGIGPIEVYMNDLLYEVEGSRGIAVVARSGATLTRSVRLDLPEGGNIVRLSAYDSARKESTSTSVSILSTHRDWDFETEYPAAYKGMTAAKMMEISVQSPSSAERRMLRGYIAKTWPDTAEGLVSRANLCAEYKDELPFLRRAIALNPRLSIAYNNLIADCEELGLAQEDRDVSRRLLDATPEFEDFFFVRIVYFQILESQGQVIADNFKKNWQARLGAHHPIFAEIDALAAAKRRDYVAAEKLYLDAASRAKAPLRIHQSLLDLRLDHLRADAPEPDRYQALADFLKAAAALPSPQDRCSAYMSAADRLMDDFKDRRQAVSLNIEAYKAYPCGEALEEMFRRGGSYWHDQLIPFLENGASTLPCNSAVARAYAKNYIWYDDDPSKAELWMIKAVKYAHTPADRKEAIGLLGDLYEERLFMHDKAKRLYLSTDVAMADKKFLYWRLYYNRLSAMDFQEAFAYLELYAPYIDTTGSWYQKQRNLCLELIDGEAPRPPSEIVVSSLLHSSHMAVSPDGKTVAIGDSPMGLWDINKGIKIRELGRGGRERAYSPDGAMVATLATMQGTSVLCIYDAASGLRLMAYPVFLEASGLCWSPDGRRLAMVDAGGVVSVIDAIARKGVATFRMGGMRIGGPMTWTKAGLLAYGQSQSNKVIVRNGSDFSVVKELGGVDWPHAMGSSADGRYLICSDNRRILTVWDTKTWSARSVSVPFGSKQITANPKKQQVLLDNFTGIVDGRKIGLALFDIDTMGITADFDGVLSQETAAFSPDGSQVICEEGITIVFRDPSTLKELRTLYSPYNPGAVYTYDRKGGYLVTRLGNQTQFWDVSTGAMTHVEHDDWPRLWDQSGGSLFRLATDDSGTKAQILDTRSFAKKTVFSTAGSFWYYDVLEHYVVLAREDSSGNDARGKSNSAQGRGELEIWDKNTFKRVCALPFPLCTESVRLGLYSPGIKSIAVDDIGGTVAISTEWKDGWGTDTVYSKNIQRFNFKGEALPTIRAGEQVRKLEYAAGGSLLVSFADTAVTYRGDSREPGGRSTSYRGAMLRNGEELRWSADFAELGSSRADYPGNIENVFVDEDRNLLIVALMQNEYQFFDLETFQRQCTLSAKDGTEWIAFTPTGEYVASEHGADNVYWNSEGTLIPFARMSSANYSPNALRDRLTAVRERSRAKVLSSLSLPFPPAMLGKLVSIDSSMPAEARTREGFASFEYSVTRTPLSPAGKDYIVPELELYQNGRRIPAGQFPRPNLDAAKTKVSARLALGAGENIFELRAMYKGIELASKKVSVFYDRLGGQTGTLYFLGVGVSSYERCEQDLRFASADVASLAASLRSLRGAPYRDVKVMTLLDADATGPAIDNALRAFLSQAKEEDLVVIFLSGHGAQDERRGLCLLTHESDFSQPTTWYPLKGLREYLLQRPILQKAVLVLDICHAGSGIPRSEKGLRRGVTSESSASDMTRETGTLYIAAALGSQSALEGPMFGGGHGAFTAALLEDLAGKADSNHDGAISALELSQFVTDRVVGETDGSQIPVSNCRDIRDFVFERKP
jgi:WD40 repeat protein